MKNKKVWILAAVVVLCALIMGCVYFFTRPETQLGEKEVTIAIDNGEKTSEVVLNTDQEYLGPALQEQEGLIEAEDGPYGLFITAVDGTVADDAQQQWWCITKAGEAVMTGVSETPIANGDRFELTLMTGY